MKSTEMTCLIPLRARMVDSDEDYELILVNPRYIRLVDLSLHASTHQSAIVHIDGVGPLEVERGYMFSGNQYLSEGLDTGMAT